MNKCRVWYDNRGIEPGEDWVLSIQDHLLNSNFFLLFVSECYLESTECLKELELAKTNDKYIVPFIIDKKLSSERVFNADDTHCSSAC